MKNGRIDKYLFGGGYAQASVASSTTDNFAFYYYNQDHLGNIREVVNASGSVQQVTNYYPFGAPYADASASTNTDFQPYKFTHGDRNDVYTNKKTNYSLVCETMKRMIIRFWYAPIVLVVLLMLSQIVLITIQSAFQRITLWFLFLALITLPVSWICLFIFKERSKALKSIMWSIAAICILLIPLLITIISDPHVPNTLSDGRNRPDDFLLSNTVQRGRFY